MIVARKAMLAAILGVGMTTMTAVPAVAQNAAEQEAPELELSKGFLKDHDKVVIAFQKAPESAKQAFLDFYGKAKTDDEKFKAGQTGLYIAGQLNDSQMNAIAYGLLAESATTPVGDRKISAKNAAALSYNAKNMSAANRFAKLGMKLGVQDPQLGQILAASALQLGGYSRAKADYDELVAAGAPVGENFIRSIAADAQKKGDTEQLLEWSRLLAATYPTADNWNVAIGIARDNLDLEDQQRIGLLRLYYLTDSFKTDRDYLSLIDAGLSPDQVVIYPTDILNTISRGTERGTLSLSDRTISDYQVSAEQARDGDAGLVDDEAAKAKRAGTSDALLDVAEIYVGLGKPQQAIALYDQAATLPGADTNDIAFRRGMAKVQAGQYDAAKADFEAVSAGTPKELAPYWLLYLAKRSN